MTIHYGCANIRSWTPQDKRLMALNLQFSASKSVIKKAPDDDDVFILCYFSAFQWNESLSDI